MCRRDKIPLVTARRRIGRMAALLATVAACGSPVHAGEVQVSVYGGYNSSFNTDIKFKPDAATPSTTYKNVALDGASFEAPPYWGFRGVYWFSNFPGWGVGFDYSHAKIIVQRPPALDAMASHFQFTDGLNIGTIDALYRYHWTDRFTPYAGLGVGISVPDVEVTLRAPFDTTSTNQYEVTGPAFQGKIGLDYKITDAFSAFAEYKLAYTLNDASLRNGGRTQLDILTNQLLVGVSYAFK